MSDVLVLTLSGPDQPGVTAGLTTALSDADVVIEQLEQIVLQDHLVLGVALRAKQDLSALDAAEQTARQYAELRHMDLVSRYLPSDSLTAWHDRLVVTVLGHPLVPRDVAAITRRIAELGGNIERIRRVAHFPVTAVEFEIGGVSRELLRIELAIVARANSIDIAVQESGLDRRGIHLVVMDVDSTLIQDEVIELLAAKAGVQSEVADITHRAMNGELDFEQSLRKRVALLKGLPASVVDEVRDEVRLTPGAATLCRTLNRLGYHIALVSGGFAEVVGPIAQSLGVPDVTANRLAVSDDHLTGELLGPIVDRAAKAEALLKYAEKYAIPIGRTVAIGDGANDLDMLHTAGLGIAFNAKPYVRDAAHASVNTPYLDTVLYLLGITREQIERADERD